MIDFYERWKAWADLPDNKRPSWHDFKVMCYKYKSIGVAVEFCLSHPVVNKDNWQDEQADDMRELLFRDIAFCKNHFDLLKMMDVSADWADTYLITITNLATRVAKLLSEAHDEDITLHHLGF